MINNSHLLIQCSDQKGLIYKISKIIYDLDLNIDEQSEFVDQIKNRFFLRTEIAGELNVELLLSSIQDQLPDESICNLYPPSKKKIIIFAGKEAHCLGDLLLRNSYRELNFEIEAVISNYNELADLVSKFDIPFYHIPVEGEDRKQHEAAVLKVLENYNFDLIVLAKYMRVLSADFVSKFKDSIINIHHSFLPAFIGAKPYHQAYEKGVKLIGATAHFVTAELDQGPIIAQDVMPVDHKKSPKDLIWSGQNIEKIVLAKALRLVLENRVMIFENKTVVFD